RTQRRRHTCAANDSDAQLAVNCLYEFNSCKRIRNHGDVRNQSGVARNVETTLEGRTGESQTCATTSASLETQVQRRVNRRIFQCSGFRNLGQIGTPTGLECNRVVGVQEETSASHDGSER